MELIKLSRLLQTGLTVPISTSCDLSNGKYHKIIMMESFNKDVKYARLNFLTPFGLSLMTKTFPEIFCLLVAFLGFPDLI